MITGVTLVLIGLIIGRIGLIGGDAHQAELQHAEVHRAEAHREQVRLVAPLRLRRDDGSSFVPKHRRTRKGGPGATWVEASAFWQ